VNNQIGYADPVPTRLGVEHLIVEVKRSGAAGVERVVS
jgi:hypothetical protein